MKKQYWLIFIVAFLVSCTSNTIYEKPKNLIPKDTMLLLLEDMYIAAAAKAYKNNNLEKKVEYNFLLFQKYKIDSTRFKESNVYYTSKIENYHQMIKQVKLRLIERKNILDKELKRQDSLQKSKLPKRMVLDSLKLKKRAFVKPDKLVE